MAKATIVLNQIKPQNGEYIYFYVTATVRGKTYGNRTWFRLVNGEWKLNEISYDDDATNAYREAYHAAIEEPCLAWINSHTIEILEAAIDSVTGKVSHCDTQITAKKTEIETLEKQQKEFADQLEILKSQMQYLTR